jgi:hypothetical protein
MAFPEARTARHGSTITAEICEWWNGDNSQFALQKSETADVSLVCPAFGRFNLDGDQIADITIGRRRATHDMEYRRATLHLTD